MRIVVCIRQAQTGEMSPFDASAYEAALRVPGAEVILLSMGIPKTAEYLRSLSRLGADAAVLLTDPRFAGADTLATAYTLSLAVRRLAPELVFCGRKTLEGDTGQTPLMLAELCGMDCVQQVLSLSLTDAGAVCRTREADAVRLRLPSVCVWERSAELRLPRLGSIPREVQLLTADELGADPALCGLSGSPTRVLQMRENEGGRRKCTFLPPSRFRDTVKAAADRRTEAERLIPCPRRLRHILICSEAVRPAAETVAERITAITPTEVGAVTDAVKAAQPDAVLWDCSPAQRRMAAAVAARMRLGLCADCTALKTDGAELYMIRPARSGSVLAEIRSLTRPAMATVRTADDKVRELMLTVGYGAKDCLPKLTALAAELNAEQGATRKIVDKGLAPYERQIGLTGKTVAPKVYLAVGVSGAVQHLVGMQRAGTVIAVNPDRDAPIFDYADYGFLCKAEDL